MALHDKNSIQGNMDDDVYSSVDLSVSMPKYKFPQTEQECAIMKTKIFALTFSSLFVAGISANAAADSHSSAVDCSTASDDISHLQHEKKSTDERKMKGVFAITPIGLVVNAATGGDKKMDPNKKMQIDDYNKKIDERIAEIKANCKVEEPENPAMQSN